MGYSLPARRAFSAAMRETIQALKHRDARRDIIIRELCDAEGFSICHLAPQWWVYHVAGRTPDTLQLSGMPNLFSASGSGDGGPAHAEAPRPLVVGVVTPSWDLRLPGQREDVRELISGFLHFAQQFVARSRALKVTASIALTYGRACDFRFGFLFRHVVDADSWRGPHETSPAIAAADYRGLGRSGRSTREFVAWTEGLNTLDPAIHRAAFQYWRATRLVEHGFWEETVAALDGLLSVGAEVVQQWHALPTAPSRSDVVRLLGMSAADQAQAQRLYELRCDFGAHPSPAKWWDFAELYEAELDQLFSMPKRVLGALCASEHRFRRVDPDPHSWADWFETNAHRLIDAVWFTRVR